MSRTHKLVALAAALTLAFAAPAAAESADVLPDLEQVVPEDVSAERAWEGTRPVFRLGFASAAANVGAGPLTLYGHRRKRGPKTMRVDQIVERTSGLPRTVRDVGEMSYVSHPDHDHWHLLGFERYEMRSAGEGAALVRRDHKTGFCLGDRFPVPEAPKLAGFSEIPMHPGYCSLGKPNEISLFTGISVGYVDRYEAQLEGQFIDVTGLPRGRYVLTHRVNTGRRILESDHSNNAASVRLSLTWPRGESRAPVVRACAAVPSR